MLGVGMERNGMDAYLQDWGLYSVRTGEFVVVGGVVAHPWFGDGGLGI